MDLNTLPEELLVHVISFLSPPAPSSLKIRHEPNLQLACSDYTPLKNLSLVSKQWRRLVLPALFRFSRLRVDIPPRDEWADCRVCGRCSLFDRSWSYATLSYFHERGSRRHDLGDETGCELTSLAPERLGEPYHLQLTQESLEVVLPDAGSATKPAFNQNGTVKDDQSADRAVLEASRRWLPRLYHVLEDYVRFVKAFELEREVESFVLLTDSILETSLGRYLHRSELVDYRWKAFAHLWDHLFSAVNPVRVVIVAPPKDLGCITNCAIDTFGDWAFSDMAYHSLELLCDPDCGVRSSAYDVSKAYPRDFHDIAKSSVLNIRPWQHVGLNEGSFLKAYGTYEYFERGPPSIVYSIANCFCTAESPKLLSFTYTAIFPFANHLDFLNAFTGLKTLDLQLAPERDSGILDDKERTGKAELEDCWQELFTTYRNFHVGQALERFVCRDRAIEALWEDLEHRIGHVFFEDSDRWENSGDGSWRKIRDSVERD